MTLDDDTRLHAYVDGQLDPSARLQVEQRLQSDPAARQQVQQWRLQREHLRGLGREVLDEPVPPALLQAAVALSMQPRAPRSARLRALARAQSLRCWNGWPCQALAASLILCIGLGAGWRLGQSDHESERTAALFAAQTRARVEAASESLAGGLSRDAMAAHAVYAPDPRRPVEIAADQQELMVRWLSKRLGRPLKVPVLEEAGWRLVGGRLLSGDTDGAADARAQLMYEDGLGQRMTLYLSALGEMPGAAASGVPAGSAAGTALPGAAGTVAFRHDTRGKTESFFWTEDRFGYALVAELPRETLLRLVNEVHAQTLGRP